MTLQDYLREVRERLEKATPGPWEHNAGGGISVPLNNPKYPDVHSQEICEFALTEQGRADCEFVASAPQDLATLAQICETLWDAVDKLEIQPTHREDTVRVYETASQAKVRVEEILAKTNPTNQTGE